MTTRHSRGRNKARPAQLATELIKYPRDVMDRLGHTAEEIEKAADLFYDSEEVYVTKGLRMAYVAVDRLRQLSLLGREILSTQQINDVFLNIDSIYDFHSKLFQTLRIIRLEGRSLFVAGLGASMLRFIPFFKLYSAYITRNKLAGETLHQLIKERRDLRHFVETEQAVAGYTLESILVLPIIRLGQYLNYLSSVYLLMDSEGKESLPGRELQKAIQKLQEITDHITRSVKEAKTKKMVYKLQEGFFAGSLSLVKPDRYYVLRAKLSLTQTTGKKIKKLKNCIFFLFNDCLIWAEEISGTKGAKGKFRGVMRTLGMHVVTVPDTPDWKNAFVITDEYSASKDAYLLLPKTKQQKVKVLAALRRHIIRQHKTFTEAISSDAFERDLLKKKIKRGDKGVQVKNSKAEEAARAGVRVNGRKSLSKAMMKIKSMKAMQAKTVVNDEWTQEYDADSGYYYFYNHTTGASSWDPPPGWNTDVAGQAEEQVAYAQQPEVAETITPDAPDQVQQEQAQEEGGMAQSQIAPHVADPPLVADDAQQVAVPTPTPVASTTSSIPVAPPPPPAPPINKPLAAVPTETDMPEDITPKQGNQPRDNSALLDAIRNRKAAGGRRATLVRPAKKPLPLPAVETEADAIKKSIERFRKYVVPVDTNSSDEDWDPDDSD